MSKHFYISTPIYYSSGIPHIGHAYSTILADVLAKYKKLIGYNVFFATGMDEHGKKIQEKALQENKLPKLYVDNNAKIFKKLWSDLSINYSKFIRTTDLFHVKTIQKIISILFEKKYIYHGTWNSWYCVSCEENYTDSSAIKKEDYYVCNIGHKLERYVEESYFLRLSLFNQWIIDFLKNNQNLIFPHHRFNELFNNFLKDNKLEDLSISRISFDWGIPILEDKKHVVYVWIDALFNYITILGYLQKNNENFLAFWQNKKTERVHILSKEITRFHCIYWPIMLKMLNLNEPTKIICHGWILGGDGKKMSKSLGNVVDPIEMIEKYGSDVLRYCLIKGISLKEDSIFDESKLIDIYNSDLANNYGNLISRTIGMIKSYNQGNIPYFDKFKTKEDKDIKNKLLQLKKSFLTNLDSLNVNNLLEDIVDFESYLNLYIDNVKPWVLFKESKKDELNSFLSILYNCVKVIVLLLSPILNKSTSLAIKQLNIKKANFNFDDIFNFALPNSKKIGNSEILFKRIEK